MFVDFDSGLNTAINRLRFVLGDSAEHPRYIETFARSGYRLVAPVVDDRPRTGDASALRRLRLMALVVVVVLAATIVTTVLAFRRPRTEGFQFRQVTFRRGQVWGARFAPDGQAILYTASWDNGPRRLFLTNPITGASTPVS